MLLPNREIRMQSKGAIRRFTRAVLTMAALFILLQYLTSALEMRLIGYDTYYAKAYDTMYDYMTRIYSVTDAEEQSRLIQEMSEHLPVFEMPSTVSLVLASVVVIAAAILTVGYQLHTLALSRGMHLNYRSLFFGFNHPVKVFLLLFLTGFLTLLGLAFLIVPGIIIAMRYGCAVFVFLDDPDKSAVQCMRESARLMKGHKKQLFRLELSFLPWVLLSNLAAAIMRLPLLDLWVYPFMYIARSIFYNGLVCGQFVPGETPVQPQSNSGDGNIQ